jgi:hypothetical protein
MTPSPLTPPPKLVQQWILDKQLGEFYSELNDPEQYFATQAAQWGADQELEACCLWMERNFDDWDNRFSDELRRHRRPKPLSLKKQALDELNLTADPDGAELSRTQIELIRRALEQLDD